jgi:hypothetical protein
MRGSGIAARGETLKNVAEEHVLLVDPVRRRQLAQGRPGAVNSEPLDNAGNMR